MSADGAAVRPDDAVVLLTLAQAFHGPRGGRWMQPARRHWWRLPRASRSLGRGWCGEGYLIITLGFSVEYGGRNGFIDGLCLVPAVRGAGLGRRLLAFALAEAAQLGVRTPHLEVEVQNERATRLYRAGGSEETTEG